MITSLLSPIRYLHTTRRLMFFIDTVLLFCLRVGIEFLILPTVRIIFFILEGIINISKKITFYFLPKQTFACRIFERIEGLYSGLVERYRGLLQSISDWILSESPKRIVAKLKELRTVLFVFVLTIWFLTSLITVLFANTYFYSPTKKFDIPFYLDYTYHGLPLTQVIAYPSDTSEIAKFDFDTIMTADIIPHSYLDLKQLDLKLGIGEYYDVSIVLELPESYANRDAGVFMLNLTLYGENSTLIASAGRPLLLKFKSNFLTYIQTVAFLPFYFLGLFEEKQTLKSLMFEDFQEKYKLQTEAIYISVSSPKVEIYTSTLHFRLKPQGLDRLILNWPITSFIVMIILFFNSFFFLAILIVQATVFIAIDVIHSRLPEVADMFPRNSSLVCSSRAPARQQGSEEGIDMQPLNVSESPLYSPSSGVPNSTGVFVEREYSPLYGRSSPDPFSVDSQVRQRN